MRNMATLSTERTGHLTSDPGARMTVFLFNMLYLYEI